MSLSVDCIMLGISARYINGVTQSISIASPHVLRNFRSNNDQTSRKIRQAQDQWYIFGTRYDSYTRSGSAMNGIGKHALIWKESQNEL